MSGPGPDIALIGLRGSGKSTLGAALARRLGRDFVDLDDVAAGLMGASGAGEAIERGGMDAFRAAEGRALLSELKGEGRIIALGGGTPTAPGAAALLRGAQTEGVCRVFYLRASVETLRERLRSGENRDRPSLTGGEIVDEVQAVFDARDGLYRELAESVVHVDGAGEDSILQALCALAKAGV